jgi:hypothetical protein
MTMQSQYGDKTVTPRAIQQQSSRPEEVGTALNRDGIAVRA